MKSRIMAIGGSAGSIQALQALVSNLSAGIPAALFVVTHIPPTRRSELPGILSRSGPLPAIHPAPRQKIEPGHIYVAPPDHHMVISDGEVVLWRGPKENNHRPAINTLFRSAAAEQRERVVGTILSGSLDDGATGLYWVRQYGGVTIVQDPQTAAVSAMPQNALAHVPADYVLAPSQIGQLLNELALGGATPTGSADRNDIQQVRRWKEKK